MTSLQERLFAMQDKQYAAFQAKLTPGVPMESFIGIRVPVLRKFAKEFTKEAESEEFLHQLPHKYYDENMLHGLLISEVKDYGECIRLTETFLPFVDNGSLRHHVSEGVCQTQEGTVGKDQDLDQIVTRLYLSLCNRDTYVSLPRQRLQGRIS